MRAGAKEEAEEAFLLPEQYPASHNHWRAYSYQGAGKQASRQAGRSRLEPAPTHFFLRILGFFTGRR